MKWSERLAQVLTKVRLHVGMWIVGRKARALLVHGVVNQTLEQFPEEMAEETLTHMKALRAKVLDPTEENIRRAFGMSTEDLFKVLAERLGYEVEK